MGAGIFETAAVFFGQILPLFCWVLLLSFSLILFGSFELYEILLTLANLRL
jgi:hypothetical protein